MVIGYVPTGVAGKAVVIVSVLEQVGLHGLVVKLAVAPAGSPEAESVTPCDAPETKVRVMILLPDEP